MSYSPWGRKGLDMTERLNKPGCSDHGILQARILEWVAMPSFRRSSQPRDEPPISSVSCTGRHVLYHWHHLGSPTTCVCAQLCLTLCNPMDCSPAGSSVHGILSARILEWVAMPSSRGSSRPRDQTCISYVSCIAGRFFTTSTTWEFVA